MIQISEGIDLPWTNINLHEEKDIWKHQVTRRKIFKSKIILKCMLGNKKNVIHLEVTTKNNWLISWRNRESMGLEVSITVRNNSNDKIKQVKAKGWNNFDIFVRLNRKKRFCCKS